MVSRWVHHPFWMVFMFFDRLAIETCGITWFKFYLIVCCSSLKYGWKYYFARIILWFDVLLVNNLFTRWKLNWICWGERHRTTLIDVKKKLKRWWMKLKRRLMTWTLLKEKQLRFWRSDLVYYLFFVHLLTSICCFCGLKQSRAIQLSKIVSSWKAEWDYRI